MYVLEVRVRVCVCLYVCVIERERWRGKKGIDLLTDGVKRDRAKGSEGWDWVKEEWKWRGRARESKGRREAACICVGSVSHAWLLRTTLLLIVCALIWVHLTCSTFFLSFFLSFVVKGGMNLQRDTLHDSHLCWVKRAPVICTGR